MQLSLHHKQGLAYNTTATEVLYGGAAGGGKSHLMRVAAICWCFDIPGLQVYLFRRTFPDLWKNHMEGAGSFMAILAEWIDQGYVKVNLSKNQINFWNGSKIHLCHCQLESNVYNYQGAEIHVLMIDELTHWKVEMYRFLRSRCRLGTLKIPERYQGQFPRILCGSNPGNIGHNWVKAAWVDLDPVKKMIITQMPKKEGGMLRQFIPAKLQDNPSLDREEYEGKLEGLDDPILVRAMLDGDWDIVAGGAIDDVWKPGIHILPAFEFPKTWRVDRSFDWGSSRPFSVGWWAESDGSQVDVPLIGARTFPKGTLFRIAELYGWNGNPDEGCKMLAVEVAREIKRAERTSTLLMGRKIHPGPADTSIFDVENGNSIADDMARSGVRWTKANKNPGSRVHGLEALRKRLKASTQHPMESPGLFVFDTCRQFIRTLPVLPRDERNRDDVDTNAEDHIYDETRYKILAPKAGPLKTGTRR